MKSRTSTAFLVASVCLAIACVLQAVGLARYVSRLPDDHVGIGLYIVALVAFAIGALGFYLRWRSDTHKVQ